MRKFGIAIPTFNRYKFVIDSFAQVLHDDRVESITIVDDFSTDDSYSKLKEYFKDEPKVTVLKNEKNLDCYFCKHEAVEKSNSKFVGLWDSDNKFDMGYLDAIYAIPEWDSKTIYQPEFAKPYFDFREWSGLTITKENVASYADTHLMTSLNACNHFVNREQYLNVWNGSVNPITSDSIYFSYCWLNAGNKIFITPNLQYEHYISPNNDGHYQRFAHLTVDFHENLMKKIRELK